MNRHSSRRTLRAAQRPRSRHPTLLLRVRWGNGNVMIWSQKDRMAREDMDQHAPHAVSILMWSPDTERLLSADARPAGSNPQVRPLAAPWCRVGRGACCRKMCGEIFDDCTSPFASACARQDTAVAAVWKVDSRGRHATICPYRRPAVGGITHAIFRTSGRVKKMVRYCGGCCAGR